jgi:HEAT repeat protein
VLGPKAIDAVPAVERILNDKEKSVREAAAAALAQIDPQRFQHLKADRKIE